MQVVSGLPVNSFTWSNLTLGEGMRSETQDPSFSGLSLPSHQPLEGWSGARTPTPLGPQLGHRVKGRRRGKRKGEVLLGSTCQQGEPQLAQETP